MALASDEIERYHRQIVLSEWGAAGQERVKSARVSVHGNGPAAHCAVRYLTAAGVGEIRAEDATSTDELGWLNSLTVVVGGFPYLALGDPEAAVRLVLSESETHVRCAIDGKEDREAVGAACAVELLKAMLALPYRSSVDLADRLDPLDPLEPVDVVAAATVDPPPAPRPQGPQGPQAGAPVAADDGSPERGPQG